MRAVILAAAMCLAGPTLAWDGVDSDLGTAVYISTPEQVQPGNEIRYYCDDTKEFRSGEVKSVFNYGRTVQVEVYDLNTGKNRLFEMEQTDL